MSNERKDYVVLIIQVKMLHPPLKSAFKKLVFLPELKNK